MTQQSEPLFTPPTIDELAASWQDQTPLVLKGQTAPDMTVVVTGLDRCTAFNGQPRYVSVAARGTSPEGTAYVRFVWDETKMRQLA